MTVRWPLEVILFLRPLLLAALALVATALPAFAHPHIFIDARASIVFDDSGAVSEVRNSWTFDEAFSAWSVQGLDTDGDGQLSADELTDLTRENMKGLAEYEFYTFAGEGDVNLRFSELPGARITYDGKQTTLDFAIRPDEPYRIGKTLDIAIADPEYYVAITFADPSKVTLVNAPAGCGVRMDPPKEMDPALADELYALPADVTELPPDLAKAVRGVQGAILVSCDGTGAGSATGAQADAPQTALEAVTQVAQVKPAPFGGPPSESNYLPQVGVFKWIADAQRAFYAMMTSALSRLKTDNTAFFVLGGLSFLYGIVHAAGPGHGKVVIGSYMLASESQVRRGIWLSFASAMVQSIVAVAFILVAALGLRMTSLAMSDAANWIVIASYGLVMLLGLWLIARKLFGWGGHHHHGHGHAHDHHHDHAPRNDMAAKAHAHLHEDDHDHAHHAPAAVHLHSESVHDHDDHEHGHDHAHEHFVTPDQLHGGWREQLGVVLAVGIRPCSGALVVLVFALSQGLLPAGILAVFLMGLGTAITVAILATIAITAKDMARRLLGRRQGTLSGVFWWLELLGAIAVFAFGAILLVASFY